ncbi:MAG: DUF4390 domain-containing protein [Gammaproteobacteria bacterium]|nr:DUF4390 domain-containing protein [Gammaproteobacteria bacterium]
MPAFVTAKLNLILLSLLVLISTNSVAAKFNVDKAIITKIGNGYSLEANINYLLTPRVKEAIANGVPIVFVQELEIIHALPLLGQFWQWQNTLWSTSLRYELRYHALTNQYIVNDLDTEHHRSFISLEAALGALGTIEAFTLPPEHMAETDNLHIYLRSSLDLLELPTPMRPGALLSSKWQLGSPWTEATW